MKKKLILSIVMCLTLLFAFAFIVSAEDCLEHTNTKWTVSLGSEGYLGDMTATSECTVCKKVVTETISKIFITPGYSSSDDGVSQTYGVNRDSIARYEELTGEKIKFGAVAALRETIGNQNPLDSKANPMSKYVKSYDYTDSEYNIISIKINGIPDDAKAGVGLICALYVNAGGRTTYIDNCAEKVTCGDKTFDEIEASPEADKTELQKVEIIDSKRYKRLTADEMGLVAEKYWNTGAYQGGNNKSFDQKFVATKRFYETDLPAGTIVIVDNANGWQFRPDSKPRPDTTKTSPWIFTEEWWDAHPYVAFNISNYPGSTSWTNDTGKMINISEYAADLDYMANVFRIYVPITYEEVLAPEGGEDVGGSTDTETEVDTETNTDTNTETETDTNTGIEGGTTVPELPDYSAVKQNWNDDGKLKILAIGNSFSDDAMDHVYQVAYDAGITDITLGKLYIGGCSLATHLANAQGNKSAYDYKVNTTGTWTAKGNKSIKYAVESDDWDFITFQQVSGYSGVADSYDDLVELISIVEPLNPSARLAWHMTWAYKVGSGHADFSKYDKDQMTMYNAIVNAVNTKVLPIDNIEFVIPSGTAVQNVRTSFIGDTTRDGYHLSYGIGRYIASMTFVKALTGLSIDNSITRPEDVDSYELKAIIESVNNAIKTPYAVTTSSYPKKDGTTGGDDSENYGVIPEGYVQLTATQMGLTAASYYNTQGSSAWDAPHDEWATCFMATKKFTREELPVGSIIEIAEGWQYRPEGWSFAVSRPGNVTTKRIVVDEDWWGSYTERAFNISQVGNDTNNHKVITLTTTQVAQLFRIIVPASVAPDVEEAETPVDPEPETPVEPETPAEPEEPKVYVKSSDCVSEVTVINGKKYRALTMEAMGFTKFAYYYSSQISGAQIYDTGKDMALNYFATKVFTDEDLPLGSYVWLNTGWKYRPEGWKDGAKNSASNRPGEVEETGYKLMDAAWWGNFNQRAFNVCTNPRAGVSGYSIENVYANFKIYIPVENIID